MSENSKSWSQHLFSGFPVFKSEIHAFIPYLLFCTYRSGFLIIPIFTMKEVLWKTGQSYFSGILHFLPEYRWIWMPKTVNFHMSMSISWERNRNRSILSQLPLDENLWLRILSNKLDDPEIIERMLQEYEQHKDNPLYSSIVEIVAQANQLLFRKEGSTMSETLEAIINEKLDARERKTRLAVNQEHARNMYNIGISVEQIALITKSSVETVNEWLNNKGA